VAPLLFVLEVASPAGGGAEPGGPSPTPAAGERLQLARGLPAGYRPGVLLLRDDPEQTLRSTLVELSRRQGGRSMLRRLVDSGFITVLVSERLRPMQAGLWGPIFSQGAIVGAALRVDLKQIRGLDHDPTGVETLAHEIRHQVDAARAFGRSGTYAAVYRAAASGDRTRSAQQYAHRVRDQHPDLTTEEAERWLEPLVDPLGAIAGELIASASLELHRDGGVGGPERER
jgi:hypothetical protein